MFQYARPNITPRTGYTYTDPDTGVTIEESLHTTLVSSVIRHRKANKLAIPDNLSEIIEDDVCRRNPSTFRKPRPAAVPPPSISPTQPRARSSSSVASSSLVNRTLALLKARTGMASALAIGTRAGICRMCSENVAEPGCYSCHIASVFNSVIGRHAHEKTKFSGLCRVDQTYLKATTCVVTQFPDAEYPEHCWKRGTPDAS